MALASGAQQVVGLLDDAKFDTTMMENYDHAIACLYRALAALTLMQSIKHERDKCTCGH